MGLGKDADVLPIYIGDDRTDEDAFGALKGRTGGGCGILVSSKVQPSDTYHLFMSSHCIGHLPPCKSSSSSTHFVVVLELVLNVLLACVCWVMVATQNAVIEFRRNVIFIIVCVILLQGRGWL